MDFHRVRWALEVPFKRRSIKLHVLRRIHVPAAPRAGQLVQTRGGVPDLLK